MMMTEKRRRGRRTKVLHSTTRSRTSRWSLSPERPTRYRWECVSVLGMSEDSPASRGCLECRHRSALQRQCWPKKQTQSSDKQKAEQPKLMEPQATLWEEIISLDTRHNSGLSSIYFALRPVWRGNVTNGITTASSFLFSSFKTELQGWAKATKSAQQNDIS